MASSWPGRCWSQTDAGPFEEPRERADGAEELVPTSSQSLGNFDVSQAFSVRCDRGRMRGMRLGIAHHLGWAVAVTASPDHQVVDRRRIELIEPALPTAPIHHEGGAHARHATGTPLDDDRLAALVADVRASATRAASAALDELGTALREPIVSMSLRAWSSDFPNDVAVQRRVPYESYADSIMYRQVLAELAHARGWEVHLYDAKTVEREAVRIVGERADEVLHGPRAALGPPWSKDHRMALAAAIVAGSR